MAIAKLLLPPPVDGSLNENQSALPDIVPNPVIPVNATTTA